MPEYSSAVRVESERIQAHNQGGMLGNTGPHLGSDVRGDRATFREGSREYRTTFREGSEGIQDHIKGGI